MAETTEKTTEAAAATEQPAEQTSDDEAATLLGEGEAEKQEAAEKKEGAEEEKKAADQTDKKDEKPPDVPEKYEFKLPEGTLTDAGTMEEFTGLLKTVKADNETAQKFADLSLKVTAEAVKQQTESFVKQHVDTVVKWGEAFKNDKDLQGTVDINGKPVPKVDVTLDNAKKVLSAMGTPEEVKEIKRLMDTYGVGNHPLIIKGLAKFAEFVGDDNMVIGKPAGGGAKDLAHKMYPNNP